MPQTGAKSLFIPDVGKLDSFEKIQTLMERYRDVLEEMNRRIYEDLRDLNEVSVAELQVKLRELVVDTYVGTGATPPQDQDIDLGGMPYFMLIYPLSAGEHRITWTTRQDDGWWAHVGESDYLTDKILLTDTGFSVRSKVGDPGLNKPDLVHVYIALLPRKET